MRTLKYILPVIINITLTFLFYFIFGNPFIFTMRPDFYYDVETGIIKYIFGKGSLTLSFIIWLFLATVLFIVRIDKKDFTLGKKIIYYVCSIGIVGAVDLYWGIYYNQIFDLF